MAERFKIELAGIVIEIAPQYPYIRRMCSEYISEKAADFFVSISPEDIERERELVLKTDIPAAAPAADYTAQYLETLAAERSIAHTMLNYDVLLFHASAPALDGNGYLFAAPGGTGKSTHSRLWRERFGERVVMVNDDKPLLRLADGEVYVCGTPWNGKHRLGRNIQVPLRGLCLLERDTVNHIGRITPREALPTVIQQSYRPDDKIALRKVLELADRLTRFVPAYRLGCNMDVQAAEISCAGMGGKIDET